MQKETTLKDIPGTEFAELAGKIKEAGGRVIVLVHPFWRSNLEESYRRTVEGLLRQTKTPVVILEEAKNTETMRMRLAGFGAPNHLILPTVQGDPALLLCYTKKGPNADRKSRELGRILREAGAENLLLGGMDTFHSVGGQGERFSPAALAVKAHEWKWLPENRAPSKHPILHGCAGKTYADLVRGGIFKKVKLMPNACYPTKPEYPPRKHWRVMLRKAVNRIARKKSVLKK